MATKTRLNVSANTEELEFIRSVVPGRGVSRFIMKAALEKARQIKRAALRQQIVEAYMADPDFVKNAGSEWDAVCLEGWSDNEAR